MIRLRASNGRFQSVQQLINSLQDPSALLDQIGQVLRDSTKERIETTKVSPNGVAFAPWSYGTYLARVKDGTASKGILNRTGNLLGSIKYQVVGKQVQVGVDSSVAPYGTYLQNGTKNMPARPFVGISPGDLQLIREAAARYIRIR